MEQEIIDFLDKTYYGFIKIPDESLENIYNLFIKNIGFEPKQAIEYYYMALFYGIVGIKGKMEEYFLMAIEKGHIYSMLQLASYYYGSDLIDLMKKYYKMAIDKGDTQAMMELAEYYLEDENNYEKMEKYYIMALDADDKIAMDRLVEYYNTHCMYFEVMRLYINYIHIINDREAVIYNIIEVFKFKLYRGKEKEFAELLNKFEVSDGDKLFTGNGVLLINIKNSMIEV